MLGPPKPRRLDEPIAVSLEDLVPPDHFYRHLEAKLDLGFVRDWARELLRRAGPAQHRPGRLLQAAADHVLRGDPLRAPAHRDRQPQPGPPLVPGLRPRRAAARPLQPDPHPAAAWASTIFQRFFEQVVELCQEAGLVWGRELFFDATKVAGQRRPRFPRAPLLPRGQDPRRRPVRRRRRARPLTEAEPRRQRRTTCPPGSSGCRASRRPTDRPALTTAPGSCWRSGGWTRTGRRSAATGARPTSG